MMIMLSAHHERMISCLGKVEAIDFKTMDGEVESKMEHWEVPKKDAIVKLVEGWKNWQRVWNLAAEHCQVKDRSQRKLAAAHRGITHHAKVAW